MIAIHLHFFRQLRASGVLSVVPKTRWWRQNDVQEKSAQCGNQLVKQELVVVSPKKSPYKTDIKSTQNFYCGSCSFNLLQAHENFSLQRIVLFIPSLYVPWWKDRLSLGLHLLMSQTSLQTIRPHWHLYLPLKTETNLQPDSFSKIFLLSLASALANFSLGDFNFLFDNLNSNETNRIRQSHNNHNLSHLWVGSRMNSLNPLTDMDISLTGSLPENLTTSSPQSPSVIS